MHGKNPKKPDIKSQLLIIIQTSLCLVVIIAAVVLKSIGGQFYANAASWYFDTINNSVFTEGIAIFNPPADKSEIKETSNISPTTDNTADLDGEIMQNAAMPLKKGTITSPYGERTLNGKTQYHKGTDIGADKGSEIFAMLDGTVSIAEKDESYGNYIVLTHQKGIKTLYAHCDKLCVKKGEKVKKGQKIALVGSTGDSDGNHLHLEIIADGKNIDPTSVIGKEFL